jgi:hypothetical protein
MKQPAYCKFTPLETCLSALSGAHQTIKLTFSQIEHAMGSPLPKSAFVRHTWWDNAVHSTLSHKYAWLHAGWEVEAVDLSSKWVRFVRKIQ